MTPNGLFPPGSNGYRALNRAEDIAEEALRVQKLALVLQTVITFAMIGTFLITLYKSSKR